MTPVQQIEAAAEPGRPAPLAVLEENAVAEVSHLRHIPMRADVVLGTLHMKLRAISSIKPGSILKTRRVAGEPLDLLINAAPVALAQVCPTKDKLGIRVVGLHKEN